MVTDNIIRSDGGVLLRQIEMKDCTNRYVEWLNDEKVSRYLETKWQKQDITSVRDFVQAQRDNDHSYLFAIIICENGQHIGNIKIGPIHPHYHVGEISYFIGEKECWNKGIASEAIRLVCEFGFHVLKLHKIDAETYDCAIGSQEALKKNGFRKEGTLMEEVLYDGKYINTFRWGLLKADFDAERKRIK